MRIRTTIIGLMLLGQLSCSNDDFDINSFEDNTSITTLNGTWKVNSFEDFSADKVEHRTQENSWDKDIIVTFDDTKNPKEISGTNIANRILGEFDYAGQRQFRVSNLGTTDVGQPEWADKFTEAILDGDLTFKINSSGLRIYYDSKTKSVTLIKE